jgi:hypothetical protein
MTYRGCLIAAMVTDQLPNNSRLTDGRWKLQLPIAADEMGSWTKEA